MRFRAKIKTTKQLAFINMHELERAVDAALVEDVGLGDTTTSALISDSLEGKAALVAREPGVLSGVGVASAVFRRVDPNIEIIELMSDGDKLDSGSVITQIAGSYGKILAAERTALNFIQRMSGIATTTACYVEAIKGTSTLIVDTRKTVPGLRVFDKYAVKSGGGQNHRQGLGDGVLIKDNHLAALRSQNIGIIEAVKLARANASHTVRVEVEVETVSDAEKALYAGADILLLDNMSIGDMADAVVTVGGKALLEASGGVTLDNVAEIAAVGVDLISVGALTHSVKALDISMDFPA